jgi:hypothetical protein
VSVNDPHKPVRGILIFVIITFWKCFLLILLTVEHSCMLFFLGWEDVSGF